MKYNEIYEKLNAWSKKEANRSLKALLLCALEEALKDIKGSDMLRFIRMDQSGIAKKQIKLLRFLINAQDENADLENTLHGYFLGTLSRDDLLALIGDKAQDIKSGELPKRFDPDGYGSDAIDAAISAALFIHEKECAKAEYVRQVDQSGGAAAAAQSDTSEKFAAELTELDKTIGGKSDRVDFHTKRIRHGQLPQEAHVEAFDFEYSLEDWAVIKGLNRRLNESGQGTYRSINLSHFTKEALVEETSENSVDTNRKRHIVLKYFGPVEPAPKHIIIGLHGFIDSSASYHNLAARANPRETLVVSYDQYNFGHDENRKINDLDIGRLVLDLKCVHERLRQQFPGIPITLMGHSMGGATAIAYLHIYAPNDIHSLQAICPAVIDSPMNILNFARLFRRVDDSEVMERVNSELTSTANSSKQFTTLPQLLALMLVAYPMFQHNQNYPIHIVAGTRDFCVDIQNLRALANTNPLIKLKEYPNGYHIIHRGRHRNLVIDDLVDNTLTPRLTATHEDLAESATLSLDFGSPISSPSTPTATQEIGDDDVDKVTEAAPTLTVT